jgi:hypothetical protein
MFGSALVFMWHVSKFCQSLSTTYFDAECQYAFFRGPQNRSAKSWPYLVDFIKESFYPYISNEYNGK